MTDKTFTDEEIVKVLEVESVPSEMNCVYGAYIEACGIYCTVKGQNAEYCHDCKEYKMDYRGRRSKATLALINRQRAEIERLNKELDELAEEHSDLIVEKDILFDIAEKAKPFFSPNEVRKMTPEQVRENYSAVMESMKEWRHG